MLTPLPGGSTGSVGEFQKAVFVYSFNEFDTVADVQFSIKLPMWPKGSPEGAKESQREPKGRPKGPKRRPEGIQGHPKGAQNWAKGSQRDKIEFTKKYIKKYTMVIHPQRNTSFIQ